MTIGGGTGTTLRVRTLTSATGCLAEVRQRGWWHRLLIWISRG